MPIDPYLDEDTGILRNLLGAKTSQDLDHREAQIVYANEMILGYSHIMRSNNFDELSAIHKWLFGDIYDWAGKIRTVDIKKNSEQAEFFLPKSKIVDASRYVFNELLSENALEGLSLNAFVKRLAYHYDQLNYIHPFREGNGRAQRIFWSRVVNSAGYEIDWSGTVGVENDEASRLAAEEMDRSALESMFKRIVYATGSHK